jgi:hypothetical protein
MASLTSLKEDEDAVPFLSGPSAGEGEDFGLYKLREKVLL